MTSNRQYTEAYAEMANGAQKDAESKLARALSEAEADSIRNAGSLMMLEAVAMGMHGAKTAAEVETHLADAATAFSDRLDAIRGSVTTSLKAKLKRPLSPAEKDLVSAIPNCLAGMLVLDNIEDASDISSVAEVMP